MTTIKANKKVWDGGYDWSNRGEEWSQSWGSSYMQWHGSLLPRIRPFLPTGSILEIAPGCGRWTDYLKDYCETLIAVDLSEECIDACKHRFADFSRLSFFTNDGKSLDDVEDNSIDFVFSFDSLVHVNPDVIESYVVEISRKLRKDGVAFIHHSNLGSYIDQIYRREKLSKIPGLIKLLRKLGRAENLTIQSRALNMTAEKMERFAQENNLQCISQELVTWNTRNTLIDCLSVITLKKSKWARENRVLENPAFMDEANSLRCRSRLYDPQADG